MENKIKKLIFEAVNKLDWNVIASYYKEFERRYEPKQVKKETTKHEIKREIINICKFVIENNISYFDQEQFIIIWDICDNNYKGKLEIIFVPTRGCAFDEKVEEIEDHEIDADADIDIDKMEIKALNELLENSILDENYELSAILRDRIKKLEKRSKSIK